MLQYLIFCNDHLFCVQLQLFSVSGALQIIYERSIADVFFFLFFNFETLVFFRFWLFRKCKYNGVTFGDLNFELISKHLTVSGKLLTW